MQFPIPITRLLPATYATTHRRDRLDFLDALRGLAAISVFLMHAGSAVSPTFKYVMTHLFDLGNFGVLVFFLSSGFIIPVSLERHGSLRRFWINRVCRLYPLYWFSIAGVLVCYALGFAAPEPVVAPHLVSTVLANITMLQDFLGFRPLIQVYWTLVFEMIFYVLVSALFVAKLHTRTATITVGLLITGLVLQLIALVYRLPLMTANITYLASMFLGTVAYRLYTGQMRRTTAAMIALLALITLIWTTIGDSVGGSGTWLSMELLTARVLAYLVFGLMFLLRSIRVPRALLHLGRISYSVYLIHPFLIVMLPQAGNPILTVLLWSVVLIPLSSATYRWIEQPGIALGRKLATIRPPHTELAQ